MTTPVVVVHFGAPDWCARTVDGLLASRDVDLEVLVVDNSGDLDPSRLPDGVVVVRAGANLGYAGGANLGLRQVLARSAEGLPSHVVVCSHDVAVDPAALAALGRSFAFDPRLGVVAPRLVSPTPSVGGTWNGWAARERPPTGAEPVLVDADWVSGTCLAVRTACLLEVGGFDEGFGSYAEDVDLCLRARDAGWRVACLTTAEAASAGSVSARRTQLAARNAMLLVAKRDGAAAARRASGRYAWRAARGGLGWLAVHHARERRVIAGRYALGNLRAVAAVLLGGEVRRCAADPGARVGRLSPQPASSGPQVGSTPASE